MVRTAMPEKVFVRMPTDLYNEIEKVADRFNIGISTAIRKLTYMGLEVENERIEWNARAATFREHPEIWHDLSEIDKAKVKSVLDALITTHILAENALNREDDLAEEETTNVI